MNEGFFKKMGIEEKLKCNNFLVICFSFLEISELKSNEK